MGEDRVYFVIDMKSFFASVECAERGLDAMKTNLVVADGARGSGTICLAISPAMKSLGIRNRCRLYEIPQNVEYILAPPRMKKYIEYAANIYAIYLKYISKNDIHVYSIDECILDVTDYLKYYKITAKPFAQKLMKEILDSLGIPSSVGIGTNMYLAKIALDITAKSASDRIGWLDEKKFLKTLWNHRPITDFWQISDGTANRLKKYGIFDMEGIAKADEDSLYREFGVNAELLIDHAWGRETCLMSDIKSYKSHSKSISSSQILPCNYTFDDARVVMKEMVQNGCYDLANQNYATQLVQIFVSYGDRKGEPDKGSQRLGVVTNLYSIIGKACDDLFCKIADRKKLIRQIGYCFDNLVSENDERYDFFTNFDNVKREKLKTRTVLEVKDKYGKNSILKGLDFEKRATQRERNVSIGGHKSGEKM